MRKSALLAAVLVGGCYSGSEQSSASAERTGRGDGRSRERVGAGLGRSGGLGGADELDVGG